MEKSNTAAEQGLKVVAAPQAQPAVRFFRIRDFDKFQHYKDRALVWIKLYVEQLDDYEFIQLPDAAKYHVYALMLLAARIGASGPVDLRPLVSYGFLEEWRPRAQDSYEAGKQLPLPAEGEPPAPAAGPPPDTNSAPPMASGSRTGGRARTACGCVGRGTRSGSSTSKTAARAGRSSTG